MKGVELGSLKRMSEVIAEVTGAGPERIGVVSGPNLAREIAQREPAASVVACADEEVATRLRRLCHSPAFRPYTSTDVVGCELGGAYKNVIALAVGMAIGLGFGDNTTASVITRGLAEIARLAEAMGADRMTLMGLAGLGDLVATCSSPLSRNRSFGERLGRGIPIEEVTASTRQVAEGVKSCSSLLDLAGRAEVYAPIVSHVALRRHRRDDALVHAHQPDLARLQAREGLTAASDLRSPVSSSSAHGRSSHRSSTSSMPTDSRTRPSGMVAGSAFQRRRRSKVDSTPPRLVACTHSRVVWVSRSAASAPWRARPR